MKIIKKCLLSAFVFITVMLSLVLIVSAKEITVSPSEDKTGSTDCKAMQKVLNQATESGESITLILESGDYYINARLKMVGNNCTIKGPKSAKIRQVTPSYGLIRNVSTAGNYDSNKNLTIDGCTWIGNTEKVGSGYSGFMFSHCTNVVIKNAVLLDNFRGHLIEFAGVKDSQITNCTLGGKYVTTDYSVDEAIQLDVTHSIDMVGNLGADPADYEKVFDDTPCENISITNNNITYSRGIGSHSMIDNHQHKYITIVNNIINTTSDGIHLLNYYYTKVLNNTISSSENGISVVTYQSGSYYTPNKSSSTRAIKDEKNYAIEISGNNLTNCRGYGINFTATQRYPSNYSTIKNNTISSTGYSGIKSDYCSNLSVVDNKLTNIGRIVSGSNSCGIVLLYGKRNTIMNNTVKSATDNGIKLYSSSYSTVKDNNISATSQSGILFCCSSYNATVKSNTITTAKKSAIRLKEGAYNSSVTNNNIYNVYERGITVDESPGTTVSYNNINSTVAYGIYILNNSTNTAIISNKLTDIKSTGIYLSNGCSASRIMQNKVINSGGGSVKILKSSSPYLYRNDLQNAKSHGIYIDKSPNASLTANNVNKSSKNGIYLSNSSNSTLFSNKVSSCKGNGISYANGICVFDSNSVSKCSDDGIYLKQGANSTLVFNTFSENGKHGIRITKKSHGVYLSENKIYKNKSDGLLSDKSNSILISQNDFTIVNNKNGIQIASGSTPRIIDNKFEGKSGKVILISKAVNESNLTTVNPLSVADKIFISKPTSKIIKGSCDSNSTVTISYLGKDYKAKKTKGNYSKFKSTVNLNPSTKITVIQTDKGQNTYKKSISVIKK